MPPPAIEGQIPQGLPALPSPSAPSVAAPRGTVPGEEKKLSDLLTQGSGVSQIHSKIENSAFGKNHPTLGKILGWGAQIPAEVGNIALGAAAPRIAAAIPGTDIHHNLQVRAEEGTLGNLTKQQQEQASTQATQAEIPLRNAQTEEATARAQAEPGQIAEENRLKDAQIQNLLHPQAKTAFEDWRNTNPNAPTEDFFKAQAEAKPKTDKPDAVEQQLIDEYQKLHPGATVGDAAAYAARERQAPQRVQPITVVVPNGQGGGTVERVAPGATLAPGTTTVGGFNTEQTSEQKQEQAADKAKKDAANEYSLAKQLASSPSPTNDLALVMRYIGATKPDSLGKLRLNNNEVALVYGTRSALGNVDALVNKLQTGQSLTPQQRQDMLHTMAILGGVNEGGAQKERPAGVPENYVYKTDGPHGKGWYKP